MVVCFSCGARLERDHECAGGTTKRGPARPDSRRPSGRDDEGSRPVLTLIRTLPTLLDPPDLPPISAA